MIKLLVPVFLLLSSFFSMAEVPETNMYINKDNIQRYIGANDLVEIDERLSIDLDQSYLDEVPNITLNVRWDTCKPLNGSAGFNIDIYGIKDLKEKEDSIQFNKDSTKLETKVWIKVTKASGVTDLTRKQTYECDILGQSWYPQIDNTPVAKLLINIDIPLPECNISLPASVTVPAISPRNPESSVDLPVTMTCKSVDAGLIAVPDIALTLTSDANDSDGHLLSDNSLTLKMLYGSDVPEQEGQEWAADGDKQYPVGKIKDGDEKVVTPKIKAIIKDNAVPEVKKINATITMNFS